MADTKQDKPTTLQASEAEPAPSAVTPQPTDELTDAALDGVAGGVNRGMGGVGGMNFIKKPPITFGNVPRATKPIFNKGNRKDPGEL